MTFEEMMKAPLPAEMKRGIATNVNESVSECGDCGVDNIVPDVTPENPPVPEIPAPPVSNPETPQQDTNTELTPDESQRVDDVINTVATPILLKSELDEVGMNEFVEGIESDIVMAEGFLTERTIVRFDKNAKKAQLYEVAVRAVAREKKDPLYRKLETVEKMKRIIEAKLRKKYDSQARKKMKEYLDRAKKSKSGILAKIAHKLSGK